MKPDKPGIWEWFDETGHKRLVVVVNVEPDASYPPYLRVFWFGGYYNVNDEMVGTDEAEFNKSEWPDRWGNYVGPTGSVPDSELYLFP